ncbi:MULTISPECIES: class I SAM-dependent methyltransferase [unclassified Helicobacter]|uniref:class I SAM-dependent methyltransferase n=1 Tax=unclassified Helicobacter TaxID=2593540 RepID=UPI000CF1B648|nr:MULTISPECIES: class I SAM-dependent methyltransferase [unclassified Helicobacter]
MKKIVEKKWDYTSHAKFYEYRPNYAPSAIAMLTEYVKYHCKKQQIKVADIGAGTGNLSLMLLENGCQVVGVEPNDAMREIGIERTKAKSENITWVRATGIETTLDSESFDWVSFGSSFNVMDRHLALLETYRILRDEGIFSCMWNHRDLEDPIQKLVEEIILSFIPHYTRGVRREEQRSIIEEHQHLFGDILFIEQDFSFHQTLENYISAWKSVKNPYWDLQTEEGRALFEKITQKMTKELPSEFDIKYTTRCWSAKKIKNGK